ncbi:MAG: type IV secretion system DNA-binding domain-containing protein [Parcubacteria group bacterium]|nr:type IV secretion system DNA-binding domain-containing protein [Parcubacteria group bacterium]
MLDINFFGETTFRNRKQKFGIKRDDRRRHFYVLGKTGMGKTSMLEQMIIQDMVGGEGVGFVDPHGEAAEEILHFVPKERVQDVVYFNPADMAYPIAFNVMEDVGPEYRHLVASGLMSVFKKIWPDVWSARMEYILNNAILALLESPGSTLLGVNRMLADVEYRKQVVNNIGDPVVKAFWTQEYARYTQRYEVEATAAIQNKVGQFIANPLVRNIIGQTHSTINMREIMDGQKIFIANLAKGRIGEDNSRLLGALLITKLQLAAMSRVDIPEEKRKDFFLYIDEFQNFATDSFVNILSEARKYRLALILSHQYIAQLGTGNEAKVRDAVFGNMGTIVTFRVGAEDAEALEKEFSPDFLMQDFVNLTKYHAYVKLMIDGIAGKPFSASTLAPQERPAESQEQEIIALSRQRYGTKIAQVEANIAEWVGIQSAAPPSRPSQQPGASFSSQEQPQVLYDARCSMCGRDTKVVFQPDGKRPTYCKSCRKKLQNKHSGPQEPPLSLNRARSLEPVLFHPSRGKQETNRKDIDRDAVRKALFSALEQKPAVSPEPKQGKLEPGQTVSFDSQ